MIVRVLVVVFVAIFLIDTIHWIFFDDPPC